MLIDGGCVYVEHTTDPYPPSFRFQRRGMSLCRPVSDLAAASGTAGCPARRSPQCPPVGRRSRRTPPWPPGLVPLAGPHRRPGAYGDGAALVPLAGTDAARAVGTRPASPQPCEADRPLLITHVVSTPRRRRRSDPTIYAHRSCRPAAPP